jgi:3-deoxy-D-manno-octulosonate 8-phosphate phosphatase (KDO 8-P phosphatase)
VVNEADLRQRARGIRMVVTDVDGVLTDAGVYYSARGEELKRFSLRDGMGVERLRAAGIDTAFLTREDSAIVRARGAKLGLTHVYTGVRDKRAHLETLERETGVAARELAYIGDDTNDIDIMRAIRDAGGLSAAPGDAFEATSDVALLRTRAPGGHGAFRELAEWILRLRVA